MVGIKDFFSRKKGNLDQTQVGDFGGDATLVGPIKGLPRRFSSAAGEFPFEDSLPYIVIILLALMAGDLTVTALRSAMIPSGAAPSLRRQYIEQTLFKPITDYDDIYARNIFNSDGFIPQVQIGNGSDLDINTARESALPLSLIGTIVHANPGKSVATIQVKGNAEKVLPYIPNDEIEGMATLIKVERKKAFIRNLSAGTLEYIQIKDENTFSFQKRPVADGPIQKEGDNTYAITRTDLEGQMSNLPELLREARAEPVYLPGGKLDGFRIVEILDNSLYTKLGIKNGDVIKSVDGEPVDSPAKAMELYNTLRSKNQVQLTMDRNGKSMTVTYNIR
jgi:general secretion pathway protein C